MTADSDPDVHNGSSMLVDYTGDSDSDRPPLQYNNGKTETRELETGVSMSWDMAEATLRDWDLNSRFGPCMSLTRPERWQRAAKLDLDPPVRVYNIMETFPELNGNNIWKGRFILRITLLAFEACFGRMPCQNTLMLSFSFVLLSNFLMLSWQELRILKNETEKKTKLLLLVC